MVSTTCVEAAGSQLWSCVKQNPGSAAIAGECALSSLATISRACLWWVGMPCTVVQAGSCGFGIKGKALSLAQADCDS